MTITGLCVCPRPPPLPPTPGLRRTHQCDAHWKPQFATPDRNVSCARRETDLRSAHPHRAQPANERKASGECSGTLVAPPLPPTPPPYPSSTTPGSAVTSQRFWSRCQAGDENTQTFEPSQAPPPSDLPGLHCGLKYEGKGRKKRKRHGGQTDE